MGQRIYAERGQRFDVNVLNLEGRWLEDDLVLVIVLQPVGILAIAAVGRPAGWLHVRDVPGFGTEHSEEGSRVHSPRTFFYVVGLLYDAAPVSPEPFQGEYEFLKRQHSIAPKDEVSLGIRDQDLHINVNY